MTIPPTPRVGGADATPIGLVRGGQPIGLVWNRQPTTPPTTVEVRWQGACTDCGTVCWLSNRGDPLCPDCTRARALAAAYRALPWWRRWATRKPRP